MRRDRRWRVNVHVRQPYLCLKAHIFNNRIVRYLGLAKLRFYYHRYQEITLSMYDNFKRNRRGPLKMTLNFDLL